MGNCDFSLPTLPINNKTPGRAYYSTRCFVVCPNSVPIKNRVFGLSFNGGPGGIRTLDLSDANRTLSQLSYGPLCYCGTLRLPQNADLLRRCRTIYGKSAYRFHYITPCGKNQDFLRIFVPDFGECSAWRESAAGDGSRSNANSPFRGIALTYR